MFVYFLNILLTGIYALLFLTGEKTKLKKTFFVIVCFVQCLIIASVRYRLGYDYYMYTDGFKKMAESGFSSLTYEDWEIGYILLNKFIGLFTRDAQVLIIVTSFISLIGPFYLIWRYSINPFMSVFLFLNLSLFYLDLNYIRQGIAISIMCFAYGFLQDRKFWRFLLLTAIAAAFHLTVLYMIPVFFFALLKFNWKTMLIYLAGIAIYFAAADFVLNWIFSRFHTEYAGSRFIEEGIYVYYAIFPLIICGGFAALSFYLKEMPRSLNLLAHMTFMMGFWQVIMLKHSLFERFSYYTMIFVILAVPEAIQAFKNQLRENLKAKYALRADGEGTADMKACTVAKRVAVGISAGILVLAFAYNVMSLTGSRKGTHGVLPYRTVLDMEIPNIEQFFKTW